MANGAESMGEAAEMVGLPFPSGAQTSPMEPRKYSTGTKGRIKMHSDKCKEFIRSNTSFNLAKEFIESIDPDYDEQVWQRFQNAEEILPELQAWLGGSDDKPATPAVKMPPPLHRPEIKPASQLLRETEKIDAAMQKTRSWLMSAEVQAGFAKLDPTEAAEAALKRLYAEITGAEQK